MNAIRLAYLAGLIDGEGCIWIYVKKRGDAMFYCPALTIGMAEKAKPLLTDLQAEYGGTMHKSRAATKRWQAAWMWSLTGARAAELIAAVMPYLRLKKPQAELLLRCHVLARTASSNWTKRNWMSGVRDEMESIRMAMKALNKKGPGVGA